MRYFWRIETVNDDESDALLPTLRGSGSGDSLAFAVMEAVGRMGESQEVDIHVERLTEASE